MADHRLYQPLRHYLRTLAPDQQQVQLSLAALETLLGPRSRGDFPTWTTRGVLDVIEADPAFRAHFDRQQALVTITRRAPAPEESRQ